MPTTANEPTTAVLSRIESQQDSSSAENLGRVILWRALLLASRASAMRGLLPYRARTRWASSALSRWYAVTSPAYQQPADRRRGALQRLPGDGGLRAGLADLGAGAGDAGRQGRARAAARVADALRRARRPGVRWPPNPVSEEDSMHRSLALASAACLWSMAATLALAQPPAAPADK